MFIKKLFKFLKKFFSKDYGKLFFYFFGFIIVFSLWVSINSKTDFMTAFLEVLQGEVSVSVFIAGFLSVIAKQTFKMVDAALEESMKTDDDHHKILYKYSGHHSERIDTTDNYFNKTGNVMALHSTRDEIPKNRIKDKHSSDYKKMNEDIALYQEHNVLRLPTVNIYTNVLGNCAVKFDDTTNEGQIPSFIISNAGTIFKAHGHSRTQNNVTVRLKDMSLDGNVLTLHTERSNYYRMLLTNRCMDYKLENGMTVRNLFEYKSTVSPLSESKMSNQIGINGVILTSDGYLLIEMRDRKKTTWKNKFAQPISLALKENDFCEKGKNTVGESEEEARERMFTVSCRLKTIFSASREICLRAESRICIFT